MAIRIKGVMETISTFRQIDKRCTEGARKAVREGAEAIRKLAGQYAPLKTGNLQVGRVLQGRDALKAFSVRISFNAWRESQGGRFNYGELMHRHQGGWGAGTEKKAQAQGMPLTNATTGAAPGVGAGFLIRATNRLAPSVNESIAAEIRKAIHDAASNIQKSNKRKRR